MKENVYQQFCGIDVSKEWLDIAIGQHVFHIEQEERAIKAFIHKE